MFTTHLTARTDPPFRLRAGRLLLVPVLFLIIALPTHAPAQSTGYLLPQEQGLEMVVHIMGEVQKPGEYRVPDRTDLLELVSKAGGPTEYARMGTVTIRRVMPFQDRSTKPSSTRGADRGPESRISIIQTDLRRSWDPDGHVAPPRLLPGDVVVVERNSWFGYKRTTSILRDLAVVASAYFLYLRTQQN